MVGSFIFVPILLLMIVNVLSFSHKSKLHNILFGFGLLTALAQIALVLWPNKNFWQLTANYQFNVIKFNLAACTALSIATLCSLEEALPYPTYPGAPTKTSADILNLLPDLCIRTVLRVVVLFTPPPFPGEPPKRMTSDFRLGSKASTISGSRIFIPSLNTVAISLTSPLATCFPSVVRGVQSIVFQLLVNDVLRHVDAL